MDPILAKKLEKLDKIEDFVTRRPTRHNPTEHRDKIRARIAQIFTWGYFGVLAITLIGVPIYNALPFVKESAQIPLKDMLMVVSGIVGGPIGFVIGFYFKRRWIKVSRSVNKLRRSKLQELIAQYMSSAT